MTSTRTRSRSGALHWRLGGLLGSSLLLSALFVYTMSTLFLNSLYSFQQGRIIKELTLGTYAAFLFDPYYWSVIGNTFLCGAVVTLCCLVVGYPVAYALIRIRRRSLLLACYVVIFSPLLVSVVVRAYGWLLLLSSRGFVNQALQAVGLVETPLRMTLNFAGVVISMVHVLLAFMVFSILSVLRQLDPNLKQAAMDLGASRVRTFLRVTLPLSATGIVSGCQTVFVLSISAFVTPAILGGGRVNLLAQGIYEGMLDFNWPLAAVQAIVLLVLVLGVLTLGNRLAAAARR